MSARGGGLLLALFLGSTALRPQLIGVGPLLPDIESDLGISYSVAGLLGTLPVLFLGLCAPAAPLVSRTLGARTSIAVCLAAVALFGLGRAVVPGAAAVIALTVPIGIGMGLAGALLPVVVKERLADRPGFGTGVYAAGIQLGSIVSAAVAVPIAHAAGGWRSSFAVFSAIAIVALLAWLALVAPRSGPDRANARVLRLPLRSGVAWVLAALFGLQGIVWYALNTWLPNYLVDEGWSEASGGALLAVLSLASFTGALIVPWVGDHVGSRRFYLAGCSAILVGALLGFVLLPGGGWLWAWLAGTSLGALFALSLALPLDLVDRPEEVGAVSGVMLGAGYILSAVGPLLLGAIRDATGGFTVGLWLMVATACGLVLTALPLSSDRLRRGIGREGVARSVSA